MRLKRQEVGISDVKKTWEERRGQIRAQEAACVCLCVRVCVRENSMRYKRLDETWGTENTVYVLKKNKNIPG